MKANTNTNKNRIFTTIGIFVLAVSISYGQGLLAEGAMKLFKLNKAEIETSVPEFILVDYSESDDSFSIRDFVLAAFEGNDSGNAERILETRIAKTIQTSAVEFSFEPELVSEDWMTTPLKENMEDEISVENWMTESFTETMEADLGVENWMTQPLSESLESEIEVEDWMTVSLSESSEPALEVESWMSETLVK